jgi:glycosyltransferase involved in cell wall biosynthesis
VKLSIVTPSFRNSDWLRLCIASVADQEGVEHEHIVQDAGSDDGTLDWLPEDRRVTAYVEKDAGMYDAVNRGFRRATGEIFAYINCDEQYLPGALKAVHDTFAADERIDAVIAHFVVTDGDGNYICHRYAAVPSWAQTWERFSLSTCALFFRRRVFTEYGLWFDTRWRDVADVSWILAACRRKVRWQVLPVFTSIFTDTGENMNLKPNSQREWAELSSERPNWVRLVAPLLRWRYRAQLAFSGAYRQAPFDYSIYTRAHPDARTRFHVTQPTGRWPKRTLIAEVTSARP